MPYNFIFNSKKVHKSIKTLQVIFATSTTISTSITASFTITFPNSCVTTSFISYAATSSTSFLQTFSTTKGSI